MASANHLADSHALTHTATLAAEGERHPERRKKNLASRLRALCGCQADHLAPFDSSYTRGLPHRELPTAKYQQRMGL